MALAAASAVVGVVAGAQLRSPDDAAVGAGAPEPSVLTAPVERRVLTSTVVTRGTAGFVDAVDLVVDPGVALPEGSGARPIVTGRVPTIGADLADGSIAIEVSGRPVLVVAGELPMYRDLGPGSTGADVAQLEAALVRLGFLAAGDDRYDAATSAAVEAWYRALGYPPVGPSASDADRLAAADGQVAATAAAVTAADAALRSGRPSDATVVAAEGEVAAARLALLTAWAERDEAVAAAPADQRAAVQRQHDAAVLDAENRLAVAEAARDELHQPADPGLLAAAEQAADAARQARADRDALAATLGHRIPRGEVVFLPHLPRRVEQVHLGLGADLTGPALTLSAADLRVTAFLTPVERQGLAVGDEVTVDDAALAIDLDGRVVAIGDPGQAGAPAGRQAVAIAVPEADPDELNGLNLRVTIPIDTTGQAVLCVPLAALSTRADGTTAVRVAGAGDDGGEDVVVEVGLTADGYAEVEPVDDDLTAGDLVELGRR